MVDQFRSPLGSPDRVLLLSAVSLPFLSTTTAFAMNLVIFLTLVGYTYATIYDKVIPGYYARGIQYVGQFNAETCFVYCDQSVACLGFSVQPGDFCYQNYSALDGSFIDCGCRLETYLKRSDPNNPNPNLPSGSTLTCDSNTCYPCDQPRYRDESNVCQNACDASQGCILNAAGNGCDCTTSTTSTFTIASTATSFNTFTPATQSQTSTILRVSTTQTEVTSTILTTTTPATSTITSVVQSTTTPPTSTITAITTSSTGFANCISYRLKFPPSCCPSNYTPMKLLRKNLEIGKRATAFTTITSTFTEYETFQATSTIIDPAPQYTTSTTLFTLTETDTSTIIVSSTVEAPTPISFTTTTSFGEGATPRTTTSTTAYAQNTNCVVTVISLENRCPPQSDHSIQLNSLKHYQKLSGRPIVVDCGSAGVFSY